MDDTFSKILVINDESTLPSLITTFNEDPSYYSRPSFLTRLKNKQITIFVLEINNNLQAFCICETANDVFHMFHFKDKDNLSSDYFFDLVSYVYNFGKTQNVHFFRCSRDFNPSSELHERFSSSDFALHERFFMTLYLADFSFPAPSLSNQYSSSSKVVEHLQDIAPCIFNAVKDSLDAKLYPEYHTVDSINRLFGLNLVDQNEFDNEASILVFTNTTLVGLNLIGFDGDKKAYISQLAIHPDHRRNHLGRFAMITSINSLKQMGKEVVYLHVTSGNPAQQLYESLGFKIKESRWVILKEYNS